MSQAGEGPTAVSLGDDLTELERWMTAHVPGFAGPFAVEPLSGGQSNPTFRLEAPSGRYVLRRKPIGPLLPSAHAIEREYRVIRALRGSSVPVPGVFGLCENPDIVGAAFFVMEYAHGRIFRDSLMPGLKAAERAAMWDAMNGVIASLHSIDPTAIGLEDFGRTGHYVARQFGRWIKQYRASITEPVDEMERVIEWLSQRLPAEEGPSRLVHGDYKVDNIVFHPTESRIIALLDWELSTTGNPLADFAFHLMAWHLEPTLFRGWAGEDLVALGIPGERAYSDEYQRRVGIVGPVDWRFYVVFSMFRLAAILQGIAKRAIDKTAADRHAADIGRQAIPVARKAWHLASQ